MSVEDLDRVLKLVNPNALRVYDDYYTGKQGLSLLSPGARAELADRVPIAMLNLCRASLGALDSRLDVEGFGLTRNAPADEKLLDIWQANDLDEWSQLCHIEALKHGISFVTVWSDDDNPDIPRIAVESAHQMAVEYAPGTRKVKAAAKQWADGDVTYGVLYLPDRIERYTRKASPMIAGISGQWELQETIPNPLGEVPVVPFVNRPSLTDLSGESELTDVMPISDSVNKLLWDLMVTAEHHAEPRRYATGVQIPQGANSDRLREEVRQKWRDALAGDTWLGGKDVDFGQFAAADLQNFATGVNLLMGKAQLITGMPSHMLGISAQANPASAEAIRSSEAELIRRVRRKMRTFGGSWERVMRLALKVRDGEVPDEALSMWTIWANPETQTFTQDADAVTKLVNGERPVLTVRAARERLRFSPTEIKRMEEDEVDAGANAATADVAARMDQARELQSRDGLSQTAALAAVGLTLAAGAQAGSPPVPPGTP